MNHYRVQFLDLQGSVIASDQFLCSKNQSRKMFEDSIKEVLDGEYSKTLCSARMLLRSPDYIKDKLVATWRAPAEKWLAPEPPPPAVVPLQTWAHMLAGFSIDTTDVCTLKLQIDVGTTHELKFSTKQWNDLVHSFEFFEEAGSCEDLTGAEIEWLDVENVLVRTYVGSSDHYCIPAQMRNLLKQALKDTVR